MVKEKEGERAVHPKVITFTGVLVFVLSFNRYFFLLKTQHTIILLILLTACSIMSNVLR